jgi:protein gp37
VSETTISWCRYTFNPWIGCAHVSEGCRHCYAETQEAGRWKRVVWGPNGTRLLTSPVNWRKPFAWDRDAAERGVRERVFCASLADVFEDRDDLARWRSDLIRLILDTPTLDWLLLTKRPENIVRLDPFTFSCATPNIWLGTTVEDQRVVARIDALRAVPAVIRFLSVEPLIGPLNLHGRLRGIDWVIIGGESGHHARPLDLDVVRDVINAAREAGCAVHVKQLGTDWARRAKSLGANPTLIDTHGGSKDGSFAYWPLDLRVREFPRVGAVA